MINRTKRVFWGVFADIFWHAVFIIVTFAATPIILQFISESLYGFWIASLSVFGYLGMFDLSIGMALTHFMARSSDDSESDLSALISTAFFSFIVLGLLVLAIGWGISSHIPSWFHVSESNFYSAIWAFRIIVIGRALSLPLSTFSGMIIGSQHMAVETTIKRSTAIVGIVLSVMLLYFNAGLMALALAHLFTIMTGGLVSYLFCKYNYFSKIGIRVTAIKKDLIRRLWSFGGYFQLGRIGEMVMACTDAILIGIILGTSAVTPYTLTSKLACIISLAIATKLPNALFPAFCQMFARGEMDKLQRSFIGLAYYSTRMAVVGSVFLLLANHYFIFLWVGEEFYGGDLLNFVFISWVAVNTIFHGIGAVLKASGDLKKWSIAVVFEGILNIILSVILIKPLGLVGVALGTTISRTLITGIYVTALTCRKVNMPAWRFLVRGVFFPAFRSVPSVCLGILFVIFFPHKFGWLWLATVGAIIGAGNILSFELFQILKLTNMAWKDRLWKVFTLEYVSA